MIAAEEFKIEILQDGKVVDVAVGPDPVTAHRNATWLATGYAMSGGGPIALGRMQTEVLSRL